MTERIKSIRIVKGNTTFHVHGDSEGLEGVFLAEGQVQGIWDTPVKTVWKSGARQDGGTYRTVKRLQRDMKLGFHIRETATKTYQEIDSTFRSLFEYEPDRWDANPTPTYVECQTDDSGTRRLEVLLHEAPVFETALDPIGRQYGNLILPLRSGQPDWAANDVVTSFQSTSASASGTIQVSNPTDRVMLQEWALTPATWTLPDFSWVGAKGSRAPGGTHATRTIALPAITSVHGGARVSLDPQKLMLRDLNNTNILPLLGGKYFVYPIPPYTPLTSLPISYTAAPSGGARAELRQPRRWSRPWGLD